MPADASYVDVVPQPRRAVASAARFADRALSVAAASWWAVALAGQWLMALYVFVLYGRATAAGDAQGWNAVMERGHVAGEPVLNAVVVAHVAFAFVVLVGGAVQLVPAIRRRWPAFHRWNGRLYLLAVAAMCVGGMAMQLTRAGLQTPVFTSALALDVLLVAAFATMAWRTARARRFDAHRRWALRLFAVASAQWFFRIALMLWLLVMQGPVGFDPATFEGPTTTTLAFAQFLLPLAVLEAYLRAQRGGAGAKLAMAGTLGAMTLATAGGIAGATLILWLPRV
jgi:hypothetical protein